MAYVKPKPHARPVIDLTGPDGNAFVLMGRAEDYARQLGLDGKAITAEMRGENLPGADTDYAHLVAVFDKHFGDCVDLILPDDLEPRLMGEGE